MDGRLYYDLQRGIVILLAEGIWGRNLHDFSIKNIYRTTTLMCFKYIWKIHLVYNQGRIQRAFATGQPAWDPKFLSQINKTKNLKVNLNELSPNTVSNTIDKCIIITFSIVNNFYQCHPYMFITENCSSEFKIMFFWAPVLNSPAENDIPNSLIIYKFINFVNLQIHSTATSLN